MFVCVCHGVTDGDIRQAVNKGVRTLEGLSCELKVSNSCGRCRDCAHQVLRRAMADQSHEPIGLSFAPA